MCYIQILFYAKTASIPVPPSCGLRQMTCVKLKELRVYYYDIESEFGVFIFQLCVLSQWCCIRFAHILSDFIYIVTQNRRIQSVFDKYRQSLCAISLFSHIDLCDNFFVHWCHVECASEGISEQFGILIDVIKK